MPPAPPPRFQLTLQRSISTKIAKFGSRTSSTPSNAPNVLEVDVQNLCTAISMPGGGCRHTYRVVRPPSLSRRGQRQQCPARSTTGVQRHTCGVTQCAVLGCVCPPPPPLCPYVPPTPFVYWGLPDTLSPEAFLFPPLRTAGPRCSANASQDNFNFRVTAFVCVRALACVCVFECV